MTGNRNQTTHKNGDLEDGQQSTQPRLGVAIVHGGQGP